MVSEPTERFSIAFYPKGIPQQSPGLRGTSYPGYPRARGLNSEGVAPLETYNAMPQSLSAVYIQLVFSTKERRPFLRDAPARANPIGIVSEGVERGHNPVGAETRFARFPRVAPSSQPWAGGRNAFGIDCRCATSGRDAFHCVPNLLFSSQPMCDFPASPAGLVAACARVAAH